MAREKTRHRLRWIALGLAAGLLLFAGAGWIGFYDDTSSSGTAVLGGYRGRWFLLNAVCTYAGASGVLLVLLRIRQRGFVRFCLIHAGLLLPLFVLETAAWCGILDFRGWFASGPIVRTEASASGEPQPRWAGEPNQHVTGTRSPDLVGLLGAPAAPRAFTYVTDQFGLRNRRLARKPELLCLGDSILVAESLPMEQRVSDRLSRVLDSPAMIVAEPAYSVQESFLRWQTTGISCRGRTLLQFVFEGNDLGDSKSWRRWMARGGREEWPSSGLIHALIRLLQRPKHAAGARRIGRFEQPEGDTDVYFFYDADIADQHLDELPRLCQFIRDCRQTVATKGGRYGLVWVPAKLSVLHGFCHWPEDSTLRSPHQKDSRFRRQFAVFCENERLPFLDLTDPLRWCAGGGELPYFPADTHLNERGHQVMAEALAAWEFLREIGSHAKQPDPK